MWPGLERSEQAAPRLGCGSASSSCRAGMICARPAAIVPAPTQGGSNWAQTALGGRQGGGPARRSGGAGRWRGTASGPAPLRLAPLRPAPCTRMPRHGSRQAGSWVTQARRGAREGGGGRAFLWLLARQAVMWACAAAAAAAAAGRCAPGRGRQGGCARGAGMDGGKRRGGGVRGARVAACAALAATGGGRRPACIKNVACARRALQRGGERSRVEENAMLPGAFRGPKVTGEECQCCRRAEHARRSRLSPA